MYRVEMICRESVQADLSPLGRRCANSSVVLLQDVIDVATDDGFIKIRNAHNETFIYRIADFYRVKVRELATT